MKSNNCSNPSDTPIYRCRICGAPMIFPLDLGRQPICSRFEAVATEKSPLFPMTLAYCPSCALPQICNPVAWEELKPRFDWITYREPEGHLDRMVEEIIRQTQVAKNARIGAISYKDTSTLDRFSRLGYTNLWQLSPTADLGTENDHAEMETVQHLLDENRCLEMAQKHGPFDLILARHIIEHTHDTAGFLRALKQLLKPSGVVLFEAPDFQRSISLFDYIPIWEEHVLYFNLRTLAALTEFHGFDVVHAVEFPYPLENAIVVLARKKNTGSLPARSSAPAADSRETARWEQFAASFDNIRRQIRTKLETCRDSGEKIALFGAGHMSCTFINFFGLADLIEFVVDNDPCKTGLFMPGSLLPILPSDELIKQNISGCLLGLSPESERKVRQTHQHFTQAGGWFRSIFPANQDSLFHEERQ